MTSIRLPIGLCIVLLVGAVAAVPSAAAAQQDQVTLTVTIVDQNGDSLDGIAVSATWDDGDGGPKNGTTASNGQVLLDVSEGEDVSLQIDDDDYVRNSAYVVEDASEQSVEVTVSEAATATVTVRDGGGQTVEDAQVELSRSDETVTEQETGTDGTVTTPDVENGTYDLTVSKDGYYTNSSELTVTGETDATRTIEEGSVQLKLSVTDDHFDPPQAVRNATVSVPSVGSVQTLSDGETTVSVPVNTEYDLSVTKEGYQTAEKSVQVEETDRNATVNIRRTRELNVESSSQQVVVGQQVELDVTDEYGDPVSGATVTRDGSDVGTTDDFGSVDVAVPSAGWINYTVSDGTVSGTTAVRGFDPNATDTPANTTEPSSGSGPGFTPVTVAAAVALLSLVALRRH